jgi:cytoskeletal protein CcmA (bactofilin family)
VPGPESPTVTRESLLNDSSRDEFAGSLPDTSPYFEAWLESLRPSSNPIDNPATSSQLNFEGALRVDCYVSGVVHSPAGTLTVSETGEVHGNILVATAIIDGLVRGDICATKRVELGSKARVIGNIETPALAIQPGAVFEGQCHFLPPPRKTDSTGSKGSSRRTRSKPDKQKETEALALAAGR